VHAAAMGAEGALDRAGARQRHAAP
jgi:hypothetical protein